MKNEIKIFCSKDWKDYELLDTGEGEKLERFGEYLFIRPYEEAVWKKGVPIWGMNYYGKMLVEEIQAGFGEFLQAALMRVQKEAPYRGPENYREKEFTYHCTWQGTVKQFEGWEEISFISGGFIH